MLVADALASISFNVFRYSPRVCQHGRLIPFLAYHCHVGVNAFHIIQHIVYHIYEAHCRFVNAADDVSFAIQSVIESGFERPVFLFRCQ